MSRFRFPWETLLQVRKREEDLRKQAAGAVERERLGIEGQIRQAQAGIDAGREAMRGSLLGPLDSNLVRMSAQASMLLDRNARTLVRQLAVKSREAAHAREELAEASRRRLAVELLRERRLALFKALESRREQAELDEVAARVGGEGS